MENEQIQRRKYNLRHLVLPVTICLALVGMSRAYLAGMIEMKTAILRKLDEQATKYKHEAELIMQDSEGDPHKRAENAAPTWSKYYALQDFNTNLEYIPLEELFSNKSKQ